MAYPFKTIEKKWQNYWKDKKTYKVENSSTRPKYYVLTMFPYPSGAGLHVGHPLGYIAGDIYSRYKRLKGFNVLHPMGYDAFGLPAEQYAIQTGQHPAVTTENNIKRYREQLDMIGFCYDWDREVRTCDPDYYHWTQWAFMKFFNHWYNHHSDKAESITELINTFSTKGTEGLNAACSEELNFSSDEWKAKSQKEQQDILLNYRLAYLADTMVNWCPALGTVLANDEIKDGLSVRGGHPVEQRKMQQWSLRITAYVERLLSGLDKIEWSESIKEIQRNWMGRSEGAQFSFSVKGHDLSFDIFTTRPDTVFGVTFMVLAPESELVSQVTIDGQKVEVEKYLEYVKGRSERDRMSEVKKVTGVFTGSYCTHPFTGKEIPIWIGDYVLGGYGTGAIMAVPAHDSRDYAFAKNFDIPIVQVVAGGDISEEAFEAKDGKMMNSDFIDGLPVKKAISKVCEEVKKRGLGEAKINYRLRDAIFSRQRYWGEPFPVYFKDGIAHLVDESDLPVKLPAVDQYLPTEDGDPPLGRAKNWKTKDGHSYELSTMPGFAGSSAYFLRYMDPRNTKALVDKEIVNYWQDVDLYIGGSEHATGHLLYSRFWNMFLYDLGVAVKEEPFKKLVNNGMIQGRSNLVYRVKGTNKFISHGLKDKHEVTPIHVDVNIVDNDILDTEKFKSWRPEYKDAEFELEDNKYHCGNAVEKMSKSLFNVVTPDHIVEKYGADTLRLYEMFLGPLEQSKPWNTHGIEGVHRFLNKLWGQLKDRDDKNIFVDEGPNKDELKVLHTLIKKVTEDIESLSYNTAVSAFMIAVNDLAKLKCHKKSILSPIAIMISPFAPHFGEELWNVLGNEGTVFDAEFPTCNESFLIESTFNYPISFNGKTRFFLELDISLSKDDVEKAVLSDEKTSKYTDGKQVKKVIVVPKRIVNVVIG